MFSEYMSALPLDKLNLFLQNLSPTNRTPGYYINWRKVEQNTKKIELSLNTLNYLIGQEDIEKEARELFLAQPWLLQAIPPLLASRDVHLDVLSFDDNENMYFTEVDFKHIDIKKIDVYMDFISESGLLGFLKNNAKRSLVDYVYGVEAGLDSNARKNRSGTTMENIVERNVAKTSKKLGLQFRVQATSKWMLENWGVNVPVDKSVRRFDVAVFDEKHKKVWVIETNYYGGGGSKLKSVCGEFITLNQLIQTSVDDVNFIWITDGMGWNTTKLPLSEAFAVINNIFNLKMLQEDYLEKVFLEE